MILKIKQREQWEELRDTSKEAYKEWLWKALDDSEYEGSSSSFFSSLHISEAEREALALNTRHHIFMAIEVYSSNKKAVTNRATRRVDLKKASCYGLRKRHKNATGEDKDPKYWLPILDKKEAIEKESGCKFHIKRMNKSKGYEIENLYLLPLTD